MKRKNHYSFLLIWFKVQRFTKNVAFLKENESYRFFAQHNGVFLRSWPSMIDDDNEFMSDEIKSNLKMAPVPLF